MDRFIGKMLDNRYEIIEVIGVGGMAVVYKAKCHRLNRFVALKVLRDEYAVDDDFRRRFYDESQAVAMLSHPNIVAVYDVSRTEGVEYIVMELIDGITLKDYMGRRGRLTYNEITFFCIQIAKALEHAHSRGIIHRDIKPQNIMLLRDGTVKVADFGIARHVSKQETYNMGEAIGSVHYVSPEQAKGSFIDNRADIYSFGVVMYEMLTGRLPFEGDTPVSVALQHINSIALPPSDYVTGIPPALEAITMKAMSPALSRRYTSATEMLADFESYRNDPDFKVVIPATESFEASHQQPIDHTRRLNNTGEVDVPRFANRNPANSQLPARQAARNQAELVQEPEQEREIVPRRREKESGFPASLLFSIFAVALFFIGALYFMVKIIDPFGSPEDTKIEVPDLVGQMYGDVMESPAYAEDRENFEIVVREELFDESKPAGYILRQSPLGKRKADIGDTIELYISKGPTQILLEDYKGVTYVRVEQDFSRLGLELFPVEEFNEEYEKGTVIKTDPAGGTQLSGGSAVTVYVSKGRELSQVRVPDIKGKTIEQAVAELNAVGLLIGSQSPEERSDVEPGIVVFQQIPADTMVDEGTVIPINYSVAPEITEPPTDPATTSPTSGTTTRPSGGAQTGAGYVTPDPYAGLGGRVERVYTIELISSNEPITVAVYVNGLLEYEYTHYSSEGSITLVLSGSSDQYSAYNTIKVTQNGEVTDNYSLEFK